jgi:hypothetical protein
MKISKCSLELNCGNFGWLSSSFYKFGVKSLQKGYTKCWTMQSLIILNKNLVGLTIILKRCNDISNKCMGHEIFECKFQIVWMGNAWQNDVPRKFSYHFDNMSKES